MSKEATLPEPDLDFLNEKGYDFQLVSHTAGIYLIINNFEFGLAYQPSTATLLINIITGYPESCLDMFYTMPDVKLANGNWPQATEGRVDHNGSSWQQWSRHYVWRSGVDNIQTFVSAVKKEVGKGI